MRRFELVEGKSSKFWEIEVEGASFTVRYGRIGSAGASVTKDFVDDSKARSEADKLIREKTGKGYSEVGAPPSGAAPPVAASKPKAAPTAASKPPAAPAEPPTATTHAVTTGAGAAPGPRTATPASATVADTAQHAAALAEPGARFQWTARWRALLPSLRDASPARPNVDVESALAQAPINALVAGKRSKQDQELDQVFESVLGLRAKALQLQPGQLSADSLRRPEPPLWRAIFEAAGHHRLFSRPPFKGKLDWAVNLCAALHGTAFALDNLLALIDPDNKSMYGYALGFRNDNGLPQMREWIQSAPEAEYRALREVVARHAGRNATVDVVIAHLFATESGDLDRALAAVESVAGQQDAPSITLLFDVRMGLDQARRLASFDAGWTWQLPEALQQVLVNWIAQFDQDALPLVLTVLDRTESAEARKKLVPLLRAFDSLPALDALIERIELRDLRPLLDDMTQAYPAAALRRGAVIAEGRRNKLIDGWLGRLASAHRHLAEQLVETQVPAAAHLSALLDRAAPVAEEAPLEQLPELLRNPPWTRPRPKASAPAPIMAPASAPELIWPPGLEAAWRRKIPGDPDGQLSWLNNRQKTGSRLEKILIEIGINEEGRRLALEGKPIPPEMIKRGDWDYCDLRLIAALPADVAASAFNARSPTEWGEYGVAFEGQVARIGLPMLPGLLKQMDSRPERAFQVSLPLRAAEIVPKAVSVFSRTKRARQPALAWLEQHAAFAAAHLLQLATQGGPRERSEAGVVLRVLARRGLRDTLESAIAPLGDDAAAMLQLLLDADPLMELPAKLPKLPAFFMPGTFARPLLRDGRALPLAAVEAIGTMLAISPLDNPYPGLEMVREFCRPDSLGAFAWDLFEAWLHNGAPSKEQWPFIALAHIGNDECARRLAPLIRAWPGEGGHARAVLGLDVLGQIGTDVALMHLHGISQKVKFKGLQQKARERIDALAMARGLSVDELADRLVPDLGLDANGSLCLDFGPRQFFVGFDEQLKPFVRDAEGARIKDLPKPNQKDDADKANEAVEAWKAIRKDARALASQQIQRLELAMAQRRRWDLATFRTFLVEHPLVGHLVRRLVFAWFNAEGGFEGAFRVAEDNSFADRRDQTLNLPDDVRIGVAHAMELPADVANDFGQILGDYDILQPFRQLGRECHALDASEAAGKELARMEGKRVATGAVFGLENKGWRRGDPQDAGWIGWFTREAGEELEVVLDLDPGTVVGDITYEPVQTLGKMHLAPRGSWNDSERMPFSKLDPILISEILRDLDLLPLAES